MKILHTADWHIGKVLQKQSLEQEMLDFFDWLLGVIADEEIDLLLVSGDIFDMANPSIRDKEIYYDIILRLYHSGCKVIITGGNHDSVGELNAPKEILSAININVVGGATDDPTDEIIEIKDAQGKLELVVAAVPFLRDRDLRKHQDRDLYKTRVEALRAGIKTHYQQLGEIINTKYSGVPVISMGHLYASGVSVSESERDIHVGNQAAIDSSIFPDCMDYVALGHIHRPQMVDLNPRIQYSGSPIALSFSEKEDDKIVLLIETFEDKISEVRSLAIPTARELIKISGTYEEVAVLLSKQKSKYKLPSFVELEVIEEEFSVIILSKVEELIADYNNQDDFKILKHKTTFLNKKADTDELFKVGTSIEELSPTDVFQKRLETEDLDDKTNRLLNEAFTELLEMM